MMDEVVTMEPEGNAKKSRRQRRNFTDEFKAGAVRLVIEEGRTIAEVARNLDLTPNSLGEWVRRARADAGKGPPGALTSSEREELVRLRRELRQAKMERDILKKAAAFFAKESA
jgi:transposase